MTRHPLLSAALAACFAAMAAFVVPATAQDPAAVGSGGDPALVGGSRGQYGNRYSGGAGGSSADTFGGQTAGAYAKEQQSRDKSMREVEALLEMVRDQLDATADNDTRGTANALRYRSDAEALIRRNWDQLGPLARDLHTANYDRTDPNDASQRYRSPYGDDGQIESKLLGGAQDAQGAMQNLEDMLLPMLQDLKQGFDNELQQRARRR